LPRFEFQKGNTAIAVGFTQLILTFIRPEGTRTIFLGNDRNYREGQAAVFPEKYFEEKENLLPPVNEPGTGKIEAGIFSKIAMKERKVPAVKGVKEYLNNLLGWLFTFHGF